MCELPVWIACWREGHRLQSGAANFVDGHGADAVGQSAAERRLARRILSQPRGDNVAHDAFVDGVGIDAGALDRLAHDDGAQLRRGEIRKRALKFSNGSAYRRYDYHIFYEVP